MGNEQTQKKSLLKQPWIHSILSMAIIFGALGGYIYWLSSNGIVYIENAHLDAPVATVAAPSGGNLNELYVQENDRITANTPVALVGSQTLYAKNDGIILDAPRVIGSYYAPGQTVMSVISQQKMRVVGVLEETKGLDQIQPGQKVTFTVDTFANKQYQGVVDEVSPASNDAGVAFSISDKRPVKKFNVYIRFDVSKYPELKTGMSAKAWVHVQ